MQHFMPRKARCHTRRERLHLWMIGLASIYEGLVLVLSLGWLSVDTRAWVVFQDWEN
jgi:hypothetical protein